MTERSPQLQAFLDNFAKEIGISDRDRRILDIGASHPYECRCNVCQEYWALLPPEEM